MAWTVPSGYEYYDKSASRSYAAGTSLSITPAAGDSLHGVTAALNGVYYFYYASSDSMSIVPPGVSRSGDNKTFQLSSGWHLSLYQHTGTATSYTILSTIGGANVVNASISPANSKITQINIPSDSKLQVIKVTGATNKITKITGTMPNTLKYFGAYESKITSVPSLANCTAWTYGYGTFYGCTALTIAPALPSSITDAEDMFYNCTALTTGVAVPANCTNTSYMYCECSKLQSAPANNSTKLTQCKYMFCNCTSLTTASAFQIKGTSTLVADNIFSGCTNLVTGPSSITNVTNLKYAFYNCAKLTSLPSLPGSITEMEYICCGCTSLTTTPNMTAINKVTSLKSAFYNCSSLTTIHSFPQKPGDSLLSCENTFRLCSSLQYLPILPNYISSMAHMFASCTHLQPQNIYIPNTVSDLTETFSNARELYGVITLDRTLGAINKTFTGTAGPIIITGNNNLTTNDILIMGSNVYKELEIAPSTTSAVRCGDTNGTLDDNGQYVHITIDFNSVVLPNSSIYVPKIYLNNDQQQPIVNWKLTNRVTETTETIENSTSISEERILAGDLIANGSFDTYLEIGENEVLNYKVVIATSAPNVHVWDSYESEVVSITKYWNGIPGSAVFTSTTYIFDATPDGQSFKIGGPVDEANENGFVVGNRGIPILSEQYPSTFNGPVTCSSELFLEINENANTGTVDKLIYNGAQALGISIIT